MWIFWAILCACLVGCMDLLSKLALRQEHEKIVGWARLAFSLPLLGFFLCLHGLPSLTPSFWFVSLGMVPLELTAFLLYLRSIRISPLSLTIPFLALTPVFTIVTSRILLKERVSMMGSFGIFAIVLGIYLLHVTDLKEGILAPLRALGRERGSQMMIASAFLYSITSNIGKRAIQLSDPVTFAFLYQTMDTLALFGLARAKAGGLRPLTRTLAHRWILYAGLGVTAALAGLVHAVGIAQAPVPYFIAVKRTSLLLAVLSGGFILKEEHIVERLLGTMLMVAGVTLIALRG